MKSQVEDLRAENTRLKAELEFIPSQSHKAAVPPGPRSTFSDLFEDIGTKDENTTTDLSIQEIAAESFAPSQAKVRRSAQTKYALDESLHVDMTHGDRKRARSASRADISPFPLPPLQKPTARTYSFQLAEPSEKRGSLQTTFFDNEEDENDENVIMPNSSPSPAKRGRTNPFMIDREASEKRKMLRAASPIAFTSTSGVSAQPHFHASNKAGGSIVDWLGISDTSGRPKKGVAVGAKVKRRV